MKDRSLTLPDGRSLGYSDLGDADGPLVVYFHGAPSSRLDLVAFDEDFATRGVRVVCPDRPGYGCSSPQPGRRRENWPQDVAVLVDSLGHERFAVCGLSSGGPYTVACAAILGTRVAAAAVVAGNSDVAWNGYFDEYADSWPDFVALMRCPDEASAQAFCDERFGPDGAHISDHGPHLGGDDRAWLRTKSEAVTGFRKSMAEAMRQGTVGFAQDVLIEARPWAFDPAGITAPVRVLHGETDTLLPIAHSKHTAEVIPTATFEVVPGHGHLSIFSEFPRIASALATQLDVSA